MTNSTLDQREALCPTVELTRKGGSLEHVTALSQVGGTCGSHTVARMIDAWRFTHGDTDYSHFTSRIGPYVDFNRNRGKGLDAGVQLKSYYTYLLTSPLPLIDSTALTEKFEERSEKKIADLLRVCKIDTVPLNDSRFSDLDSLTVPILREYGGKSLPQTNNLVSLGTDGIPPREGGHPALGPATSSEQQEMVDRIRDALREKKHSPQPVAISFCAKVLRGDTTFLLEDDPKKDVDCWSHAALIAGMKMVDGRCDFLIQNSWKDPSQLTPIPVERLAPSLKGAWQLQD